ncbi:lipopolysaccharide assembly protein LapB [Marinoscillum sp. MHG1-6]|uniref:tetratricopeptide repeat protein n=1 Tax=Marinoscillum sp. MHG1-6 TaxID=2959627 RepID=UPI0021585C2F|nr:hypothetical protein [Marinoscillum sp. MHG1-6]
MKMQIRNLIAAAFFLGVSSLAVAQPGWNWGDSIDKAKENNALYTDFLRSKNYKGAVKPLEWLLTNTPDLNKSIYINGATIYEELSEKTTDPAQKLKYQEKSLEMYDKRIQYFGEEANVMNRKALASYKFFKSEQSKYPELMELFDKAFKLNGNDFYSSNLTAYMDVMRRYKLTGGEISDEEVFDKYSDITGVIAYQKANGGNDDRMDKVAEYVDKLLTATVTVDCDFVDQKLGPKMIETQDPKLARTVFALMKDQSCLDRPLALTAAEIINQDTPDFGITKFIAQKHAQNGDYSKATEVYEQAISMTEDTEKQAELYLSMGKLFYAKGDKPSARSNARKAISINPSFSDAYKFIGDLYMSSFDDCKASESRVKDRAVYYAAKKMYMKAGDSEAVKNAEAQFPTMEIIFGESYKEGDVIQVGCWINESVTIERNPN